MKRIVTLICLISFSLTTFGQINKYNYKSKLEPNSKLITRDYNTTLEKLKNGQCIFKYYYPENKVITTYITLKSKKSSIKDGLFYNQTDEGEIMNKGYYVDNKKEGLWIENYSKGEYKNNLKEGKWTTLLKQHVIKEEFYKNGKLDGDQFIRDTLGNLVIHRVFDQDEKLKEEIDSTYYVKQEPAKFVDCSELKLPPEELQLCSTKETLKFIYSNIKYPKNARKQLIDGIAIAELTIAVNGSISNIKMIRGLSIDIKNECIRVLSKLPNWIPAKNNGQPVESKFRIPIKFEIR